MLLMEKIKPNYRIVRYIDLEIFFCKRDQFILAFCTLLAECIYFILKITQNIFI